MSRGVAVAIAVGLLGAVALSGCASGGLKLPCSPQPAGKLCLKVFHDSHAVTDAIGYLSASESPLAGRTWRLVLIRYACDPGAASSPSCSAAATYPGPTRHGNPPRQTSCRDSDGKTITAPSGCHDTLASEYASMGDFTGFAPPKRLPSGSWLCVSEELRSGSSWTQPDPGSAPTPTRACARVP